MSDYEEVDEEQQRGLESVLRRYQQKGAGASAASADRRKETSKLNMEKARAAKIAKLRAQKEEQDNTYEVSEDDDDDDDYTESDEDEYIPPKKKKVVIMKGKGKGRQTAGAVDDGAMARLAQMEIRYAALPAQLEKEKRQRRAVPKPRKTAVTIQVAPPAAPKPAPSGKTEQMRRSLLII